MTDTMTSQNINLSSWDTLYIYIFIYLLIYLNIYVHRIIQEKKVNILVRGSIDHCDKKVHINMCLILNGHRDTAVRIRHTVLPSPLSADLTPLDFCSWGRTKREVYKRKVDTRDELFSRTVDVAVRLHTEM